VANGRKKYVKEFDGARAAQARDENDGSPACGRAWSNQGSIATTLRDLGVDLEQSFSGPFIPLSSIYHGRIDLAAGRAAAQFPASTPPTLEALGLSKCAAVRPGTRAEPTAASHVYTDREWHQERPRYARGVGMGGVTAQKSSGQRSSCDEYYADSAKQYFLSRGVEARSR
jgi:hypothetical protein